MQSFKTVNGIKIKWTLETGEFGEVDILQKNNEWELRTETMGKEFVKKLFCQFVDEAEMIE